MKIARVMIAGDRSSAGKTTVCIGLLSALRARGLKVQAFKVGPDYIDPGFHTEVSGRQSRNLDGFLMEPKVVKEVFIRSCNGADIAVIEGVRGLYEGLNYSDDVGSTAQIAKILDCPVILLIDASSITRSVAAVINGYRSFDPEVQIMGVILNNIGSDRHGEKAQNAVEKYSGINVIGKIPRKNGLKISMRHLGLVTATECKNRWNDFNSVLDKIKRSIEENLDLNAVCNLAKSAPALEMNMNMNMNMNTLDLGIFHNDNDNDTGRSEKAKEKEGVRIAVAFDEAFNFYYQDTFELLTQEGAALVYFSPLRAKTLPDGIKALYIGGGFPELYARELSSNTQMIDAIKDFYRDFGIIYAECGGLIYLMEKLETENDHFEMCGLIKGVVKFWEKRVINYVEGEFQKDCILGKKGSKFKGHEFHHSTISLDDLSDVDFAYKIHRGEGIVDGADGITSKNCLASFVHLHAASYTAFAKEFIDSAVNFKCNKVRME